MKKSLMLTMAFVLIAGSASAAVLMSDDFSYPDGPLVGNGMWANHSGTLDDLLVENGMVKIEHGIPSEDANHPFTPTGTGNVFFGFDFSVDNVGSPIAPSDHEYFIHLKDDGFNFAARVDIVSPTGGGDFSLGLSSDSSTAQTTWPADLAYDTIYRVVVRYDQDNNVAQLWVNPAGPGDASITAVGVAPGDVVTQIALRQSDSTDNETVRVDNLVVATDCENSFESCSVPVEGQSWGVVKGLYR